MALLAPIHLDLEPAAIRGLLGWPGADLAKLEQHDHNRVTEDGAEAVALALAHRDRGWRVVRRLQREEHADWLLEETREGERRVVALEVSGVDRGGISARLAEKLAQVSLARRLRPEVGRRRRLRAAYGGAPFDGSGAALSTDSRTALHLRHLAR